MKCPCVAETSRDPNKTEERADDKCRYCDGTGDIRINTSHDRPPIPTCAYDWCAWVDGCEESGPNGYGPTEGDAIENLMSLL